MKMWSRDNNLLIFIFVLVAIEAFLFFSGNIELNKKQKIEEARLAKIEQDFNAVSVLAKSFSVYDATDKKEIYTRNKNEVLPLASLSKIMTVIVALEKYNQDDTLTISKTSTEDNNNNALAQGEKWKIGDLAKFTLISSSNTGALTLAQNDKYFLSAMNNKIGSIGAQSLIFSNFTGLDINKNKAGSYGKAHDVNLMAIYGVEKYPEVFKTTTLSNITFKPKFGIAHKVKNTNIIVEKIPNLFFSKTGLTTLAGGNLTIIFKNKSNHNIAITLLGSTEAGRFTDMEKLVGIAYAL